MPIDADRGREERLAAIRPATPQDAAAITRLAVDTELFDPDDAGFVRAMMDAYFEHGRDAGHDCVVDEDAGEIVGVAYSQPRGIADRVADLTMIAVAPARQGRGRGGELLGHVERAMRERGQRLLLIDTSSGARYDRARALYARHGYHQEARVRDYWEPGDDLVIFRKDLARRR